MKKKSKMLFDRLNAISNGAHYKLIFVATEESMMLAVEGFDEDLAVSVDLDFF